MTEIGTNGPFLRVQSIVIKRSLLKKKRGTALFKKYRNKPKKFQRHQVSFLTSGRRQMEAHKDKAPF